MMRKDVSRGGDLKIRKNDEKRRFRRSKVKVQKIRKMMRKDVLGVGEVKFQKIRKNYEKRRFKRWRRPNSENPKK